jgi:hypothetical protein
MGSSLSREQVLDLAPDTASIKAANKLLSDGKWPLLGADDQVLWGLCQGSGTRAYQTQIDLNGLVSRCSCPSRKFPCKHSLALMLLYSQNNPRFTEYQNRPDWVNEWLSARRMRAEKKAAKAKRTSADPQAVAAAAAKRAQRRWKRIAEGVTELQRWLTDCYQRGFANLDFTQRQQWEDMIARSVDAQAPGIGRFIQQAMDAIVFKTETSSYEVALEQLGLLQLLIDAVNRHKTLSPERIMDLRAALGWSIDKEEVINNPDAESLHDIWRVVGQFTDLGDRNLLERRIWLYGANSNRYALILDFTVNGQHWDRHWTVGHCYQTTLRFYPGLVPMRALASDVKVVEEGGWPEFDTDKATEQVSRWLGANPWLQTLPMALAPAWPVLTEAGCVLSLEDGTVPLKIDDYDAWLMIAQSGGHPLRVFGEWNGRYLRPMLTIDHQEDVVSRWQVLCRGGIE